MIYGVYTGLNQDTVLTVKTKDKPKDLNAEAASTILGADLCKVQKDFFKTESDATFVDNVTGNEKKLHMLLNKDASVENLKSLKLALFLAPLSETLQTVYDRIYITGDLKFEDTVKCCEISQIQEKFSKIQKHEEKEKNKDPGKKTAFFYVSDQKFVSEQKEIDLICIKPGTEISHVIEILIKKGTTKDSSKIDSKLESYIENSGNIDLRIEYFINGRNDAAIFEECRKICREKGISFSYYIPQTFSISALKAMKQYVEKNTESTSWVASVSRMDEAEIINKNLCDATKGFGKLSENETLHVCTQSKKAFEELAFDSVLILFANDRPVIKVISKETDYDYEVIGNGDSDILKYADNVRECFCPSLQDTQNIKPYTMDNDPFAIMTKKSRLEKIFDEVFKKNVSFDDVFKGDLKVKDCCSVDFLNERYGDCCLYDLLEKGEFLVFEFIFYEVIDHLFRKRNPDCIGMDYFSAKKDADFQLKSIDFDLIDAVAGSTFSEELLFRYLDFSMRGNSHDLSQNEELYRENKNSKDIICDDRLKILSFLQQKETYEKLVIIPDNGSVEFFADISLALFLLSTNKFKTVVFKMNSRPKFVSDVTKRDYELLKSFLKRDRLAEYLFGSYEKSGRLLFEYNEAYTQIPYVKDFPESEIKDLKSADLVVVKGDLNFRRFLLDGDCDHKFPLESLLPEKLARQKFIFLRMIKSSLVAGLTEIQAEEVSNIINSAETKEGVNSFYSSGNFGMICMTGY